MKILLNEKNEIIGYVTDGDLQGSIEAKIPPHLLEIYEPKKLKYINGEIDINPEYNKEIEDYFQNQQPQNNGVSGDIELRQTFGSLQMSSVQTVKMVMDLSKQVSSLTKQNVELQKILNDKGVE